MMKKIIIASDSFKGSVSSVEVAQYVMSAVHKVYPACEVVSIPVSDGGEGMMDVFVSAMNATLTSCDVHAPLMNIVKAEYAILGDGVTAVIEMATASGLPLVPADKRNPMLTSTYGTGELIKDALQKGCRNFLIGIGGSATNDAGTGMLQALGFRFLDKDGAELGSGGHILEKIAHIDHTFVMPQLGEAFFTIACDVNNPFSGVTGASHVFARQKGADDNMVESLDRGLRIFAQTIREKKQKDIELIPGAGAAGGLGGGFLGFLKAELKSGIHVVLEALNFDERIRGANLIITGEGKLDKQTGMGKAPGGVLKAAQKQNIPVIALGGCVEEVEELNKLGFLAVLPILPYPVTLEQAMDKEFTGENVRRAVEQQLRVIRRFTNDM